MVNQAFADTKNTIDEGYIQMGHDNEGSFIKFNNLPLSSPLKYFVYGGDFTQGTGVISGLSDVGLKEPDIIIPDGCREITPYAFYDVNSDGPNNEPSGNNTVVNFIMADTVTKIGKGIFWGPSWGATELKYAKISKNLKSITDSSFRACPYLTKIDWYEGLEKIELAAFSYSGFYGDIELPRTVEIMEPFAFSRNDSLENFRMSSFKTNVSKITGTNTPWFSNINLKSLYLTAGELDFSADALAAIGSQNLKIYVVNQSVKDYLVKTCKVTADKIGIMNQKN